MSPARPATGLAGFLQRNLSLLYAAGVLGAFLQISGGTWDVASHSLGIPDTFFTPSHSILYAGVGIAALAGLGGIVLRMTAFRASPAGRTLVAGLGISFVGSLLQGIAGPADFAWHEAFGFDPFLFTPSHSLLIAGIILVGVGMAVGSARLLRAREAGVDVGRSLGSRAALRAIVLVSLSVLWLDLNGLVYILTDVQGMAYTFRLGDAFVDRYEWVNFAIAPVALALTGTLVLLAAKRVVGGTRGVSAVAILAAAVVGLGNVAFRASYLEATPEGAAIARFIPLYVAFLIPVVFFDLALPDHAGRRRTLVAAALVAPFASFLDGWHGTFLWTAGRDLLPLYVAPMVLMGLVAGLLSARFTEALLARERPIVAAA